jgi:hypothetical protein
MGLVAAAVYSLWMSQKVFHGSAELAATGRDEQARRLPDLSAREMGLAAVLMASAVWLGIYPVSVLRQATPAIEALRHSAVAEVRRTESAVRPSETDLAPRRADGLADRPAETPAPPFGSEPLFEPEPQSRRQGRAPAGEGPP